MLERQLGSPHQGWAQLSDFPPDLLCPRGLLLGAREYPHWGFLFPIVPDLGCALEICGILNCTSQGTRDFLAHLTITPNYSAPFTQGPLKVGTLLVFYLDTFVDLMILSI